MNTAIHYFFLILTMLVVFTILTGNIQGIWTQGHNIALLFYLGICFLGIILSRNNLDDEIKARKELYDILNSTEDDNTSSKPNN